MNEASLYESITDLSQNCMIILLTIYMQSTNNYFGINVINRKEDKILESLVLHFSWKNSSQRLVNIISYRYSAWLITNCLWWVLGVPIWYIIPIISSFCWQFPRSKTLIRSTVADMWIWRKFPSVWIIFSLWNTLAILSLIFGPPYFIIR